MTSRRWAVIFFVSLAVNIFLLAVIGAGLWKHYDKRGFRGVAYSLPWAVHVVGEDTRGRARELFRAQRDEFFATRREFGPLHMAVRDALTEEPFDREKLNAALADLRDQEALAQSQLHALMTAFAEGLDEDQRDMLAAAIENMVEKRAERARHRAERRAKRQREREGD